MKKTIINISTLLICLSSCIREDELELFNLQEDPGYFIECYLKKNDVYKLSATKIQPIHEDYILDYSLEFKVQVDTIHLLQSLYKEENSTYIYNYGSPERFTPNNTEEVYLTVISTGNDTITGRTTIPDQVNIKSASLDDNTVSIIFTNSDKPLHNYYIAIVNLHLEEEIKRYTRYLDYSEIDGPEEVEFNLQPQPNEDIKMIEVRLKRVTRENYNYQISLMNASSSNNDNLTFPTPLDGNIKNAMGIFTCYTEDTVVIML